MRFFVVAIFAVFAILQSCRPKPIDIDIPELEPKVVVFSQAIPNQTMLVLLTRSFGALDFKQGQDSLTTELLNQILEDSATVTITYLGQTDTLVPLAPGIYSTTTTIQYTEQPYTLDIYTNKEEHLTSTESMLAQVFFDQVTPVVKRQTDDTTVMIRYAFNDLPGKNFYMLHVYSQADSDTVELDQNNFFAQGSNVLQGTKLLSDQTFSSSYFQDSLQLPFTEPTDSIVVTISNISEKYYNYLVLREQASNWFTQILQEPVNYPTNIEGGGYGFFNTHFPDIRFYDLNQW